MKYINFKRYKFSTVIKKISALRYDFLKVFKFRSLKSYNFGTIYKYADFTRFKFVRINKFFNPRKYNFNHIRKVNLVNSKLRFFEEILNKYP